MLYLERKRVISMEMIIEITYKDGRQFKQSYVYNCDFIDRLLADDSEQMKQSYQIKQILIREALSNEFSCDGCAVINDYSMSKEQNMMLCAVCGFPAPEGYNCEQ